VPSVTSKVVKEKNILSGRPRSSPRIARRLGA